MHDIIKLKEKIYKTPMVILDKNSKANGNRRKLLKYKRDYLPKSILTYQIYVSISPEIKKDLCLQPKMLYPTL